MVAMAAMAASSTVPPNKQLRLLSAATNGLPPCHCCCNLHPFFSFLNLFIYLSEKEEITYL
jgi:hypothetical protein